MGGPAHGRRFLWDGDPIINIPTVRGTVEYQRTAPTSQLDSEETDGLLVYTIKEHLRSKRPPILGGQ